MEKYWELITVSSSAFTTGSTAFLGGNTPGHPATVLRMLGEYAIGPTAAPTALDSCLISIGIAIVSADAAELGSTAMPDPSVEVEFSWLYWAEHAVFFSTTAADPNGANATVRKSFDVRSMRKIKPRETLAMVAQYVDVVGAPPVQLVTVGVRVLFAE